MGLTSKRICVVQRGEYVEALHAKNAGEAETYQGQFASIRSLQTLAGTSPSLVLSIGSRHERLDAADGGAVTYPRLTMPLLPAMIKERLLAAKMIRDIRGFKPSHLLLRLTGEVGVAVLRFAIRQRLPTGIIIASTLDPRRSLDRKFCRLANDPCVAFVANHLNVATESLIACGLNEEKAIAYDVPDRLSPEQFAPKRLPASPFVLYVGTLSEDKGVGDLLDALALLRKHEMPVRAVFCGDGPLAARCAEEAKTHPDAIEALGRVSRDRVTDLMRDAAIVVVPSRPSFAEGLPLSLLDAFAARTPVVASAHPVFTRYFEDGEGCRFFKPGFPSALASSIAAVLASPVGYKRLSDSTAAAWARAQATQTYDDMLAMLAARWGV